MLKEDFCKRWKRDCFFYSSSQSRATQYTWIKSQLSHTRIHKNEDHIASLSRILDYQRRKWACAKARENNIMKTCLDVSILSSHYKQNKHIWQLNKKIQHQKFTRSNKSLSSGLNNLLIKPLSFYCAQRCVKHTNADRHGFQPPGTWNSLGAKLP